MKTLAQVDIGLQKQEEKLQLAQHSLELETCKACVKEARVSIGGVSGCSLYFRSAEKCVQWVTKGQSRQGFRGYAECFQ